MPPPAAQISGPVFRACRVRRPLPQQSDTKSFSFLVDSAPEIV